MLSVNDLAEPNNMLARLAKDYAKIAFYKISDIIHSLGVVPDLFRHYRKIRKMAHETHKTDEKSEIGASDPSLFSIFRAFRGPKVLISLFPIMSV